MYSSGSKLLSTALEPDLMQGVPTKWEAPRISYLKRFEIDFTMKRVYYAKG